MSAPAIKAKPPAPAAAAAAAPPKPAAPAAPPAAPAAPASPSPAAEAKPPGDSVKISSEVGADGQKKPENAFEGVADKTSTVTVDPYKKGKNDTIEGILRNQGYSLQDIYNKDKNGKTLIDHVASVNNLKNPNVIQDGASLKVPGRENSESLSSMDLKPGEQQETKVKNNEAGVQVDSNMEKKKDGSSELEVGTKSEKAPDANLKTETTVGKDGRIDSSATAVKDGVEVNTVAQNSDGSAVTQEKIEAKEKSTDVSIKDIDRKGDDMKVKADGNAVNVTNPGSEKAGDVTSKVDISESSSDGMVENFGRGVAEFFGFEGEQVAPVQAEGVGEVRVNKNEEGQARVSTVKDGEESELFTTAGDTDDTFVERAGEAVDEGIDWVGDKAKGLWNWVTGNEAPAAETEKSDVFKQTRRGRRRVR
jgi:hypothetical protein